MWPSFITFIALLIPIVGIVLGFDAVNSERSNGTLSLVLSQPIYRDAFINGKFLAGVVVMAIMLTSTMLVVSGMGLRIIGVPPNSEEVFRLFVFLLTSIVYGSLWLGIGILFSILLRRTATSVLASIAIWIFFSFFIALIARWLGGLIVPLGQDPAAELVVQRVEIEGAIMRISPIVLFEEAMACLLIPSIRSLGPLLPTETIRMLPNPLPMSQSLLLVWPQLTGLIAITAVCFAISYLKFTRQEIRPT